jgi:hypothetical protein
VNLVASIYLVQHLGAIGVAYGTLLGSLVSVGMHFALSMHYTFKEFAVSRIRLSLDGLGRPLLMAIPSLLLLRFWWFSDSPAFTLTTWIFWAVTTLLVAWFAALNPEERRAFARVVQTRMSLCPLK